MQASCLRQPQQESWREERKLLSPRVPARPSGRVGVDVGLDDGVEPSPQSEASTLSPGVFGGTSHDCDTVTAGLPAHSAKLPPLLIASSLLGPLD